MSLSMKKAFKIHLQIISSLPLELAKLLMLNMGAVKAVEDLTINILFN